MKACGSLWVTNQRIHATFLPPDLYIGFMYLTSWTSEWICLNYRQCTLSASTASLPCPAHGESTFCLFTKWFSEGLGRRTSNQGGVLTLAYHEALRHQPPVGLYHRKWQNTLLSYQPPQANSG